MSIDALTSMPAKFAAGETWKVSRSYALAPAGDGWVVTFYFINAANTPFSSVCTADGDDHVLEIAAATTAAKAAGLWFFEARAVKTTETVVVESGRVTVSPNFSTIAAASDQRTHAQKMLDAIEAALEGRASETLLEYSVNTGKTLRQLKHMSHAELMATRDRYKWLVASEVRRTTGQNGNIYARFS